MDLSLSGHSAGGDLPHWELKKLGFFSPGIFILKTCWFYSFSWASPCDSCTFTFLSDCAGCPAEGCRNQHRHQTRSHCSQLLIPAAPSSRPSLGRWQGGDGGGEEEPARPPRSCWYLARAQPGVGTTPGTGSALTPGVMAAVLG